MMGRPRLLLPLLRHALSENFTLLSGYGSGRPE
jgi:hypothetical protein